jgi:heterodisulfide reductase subunit D
MGIIEFIKNIGKTNLFYPGCMLKFGMEKELANYKEILNFLGIDFIMIPEEVCCGSPVKNAGYLKDARKLAEKNLNIFKERRVKKIITPCPGCYNMFKNEYPKLLRNFDIEVEHLTQTLVKELKRKKQKRVLEKEIVSYHDPCHLGRFSNIYEEPREIIKILRGELKEMIHNREEAICCGAGGGLRSNHPTIAKKIAKKRMAEAPVDAVRVLTPCGLCASNLKTADPEKATEFSNWVLERIKQVY